MPYNSSIANYSSAGINRIFSTKKQFSTWLSVWQNQIKVRRDMSVGSSDYETFRLAYDEISRVVVDDVIVKKFQEYEKKKGHDIQGAILHLSETLPNAAKVIHDGMTSMDVDDNGRVMQQKEGLAYILGRLESIDVHVNAFPIKGKKVSGAIGTSEDLIKSLGSKELASEFSGKLMAELGLDYFKRCTQIYPREQDLALGNYLLGVAKKIKNLVPGNELISEFFDLMDSRVNTLYNNAAEDIDHRTIADSAARRVEIPELFMLLDGIINVYPAGKSEVKVRHELPSVLNNIEHSEVRNPLSRYASDELVAAVTVNNIPEIKNSLKKGLVNAVYNISRKVEEYKDVVYIARTHLQPAELTTVGRFLGLTLDKLVGYAERVDGLSDPDSFCDLISELGASLSMLCNTFVFKQSQRQWGEPFMEAQVGSSAMPYKRNPNKTERVRSLARMIYGRVSSVRHDRLLASSVDFPELLLLADGMINSINYIFGAKIDYKTKEGALIRTEIGMKIDRGVISKEIEEYKSEIFQTELLSKATKNGAVREKAHTELNKITSSGNIVGGIKSSEFFKGVFGEKLDSIVDSLASFKPDEHIGTSISDVNDSLSDAKVILDKYSGLIDKSASSKLTV